MKASGPGRSRGRGSRGGCLQMSPEAEAFLLNSMPKTQSPGTLSLNHVDFLNSNNNDYSKGWWLIHDLTKMGGVSLWALCAHHEYVKLDCIEEQFTDYHQTLT